MYKFYINDIETNEPLNWKELSFNLAQDPNYFGYFRNGAIEKAQLYGKAAKQVKYIYDTEFNPITTYRIEKKTDLGLYVVYQNCVIDYNGYSENDNGKGLIVSVDLIDSNLQGKLRNRESNEVVIGNNKSIEYVDVNALPLIDIQVSNKVLRHSASFKFSELLQKTQFYNGSTTAAFTYYPTDSPTYYYGEIKVDGANRAFASFNIRNTYLGTTNGGSPEVAFNGLTPRNYAELALEVTATNTNLSNSSYTSNHNLYNNYVNLNSKIVPQLNTNEYKPRVGNVFWKEAGIKRNLTIKGTIKLNVIWRHNVPLSTSNRLVSINLQLVKLYKSDTALDYYDEEIILEDYTAPDHTLHAGGVLDPISPDTELPQYTTTQVFQFDIDRPIIQEPNTTLAFRTTRSFNGASYLVDVVPLLEDNGTAFEVYYDDELGEFPDSVHKGQLVHECLQSVIEQIVDKPNTFYSSFFGRTDIGYPSNGIGSGLAFTNGYLLRNGESPNGDLPTLVMNFQNLYKTLDSIYGLMMFYKNGKIHIEKRSWERDEVIKLYPKEISIYPLLDKMFTEVLVGNNKITYEDVNGTNEFNSVLTFSSPLNARKNTLDLVTDYQTDYTGIENSRRLSFKNAKNVDTKYDLKNFLFEVVFDGIWKTKPIIGNWSVIDGLILPATAYNLGISPKRMLLNNRDLIDAMLHKSNLPLRFEKADNLAPVESQKIGEPSLIIEQSNVPTEPSEFKTEIYELTIGKRNAEVIFENTNNLYSFDYLGVTLYGFLYDIEENENEVKVKLIRK